MKAKICFCPATRTLHEEHLADPERPWFCIRCGRQTHLLPAEYLKENARSDDEPR